MVVFVRRPHSSSEAKRRKREFLRHKSKYDERRAMGICVRCGLEDGGGYAYCPQCREIDKQKYLRRRQEIGIEVEYQSRPNRAPLATVRTKLPGRTKQTPKTGENWSSEEDARLIAMLDRCAPLPDIVRDLRRSEKAIKARATILGRNDFKAGNFASYYIIEQMKDW